MNDRWILSHKTCPQCDREYDAGLSGVIREDSTPATIGLDGIVDVCVTRHEGDIVLYFHHARHDGGDDA